MKVIDFHNHYYPPAYLEALRTGPTTVKLWTDDEGNPVLIRFNRKTREHYLTSLQDGEPSGWTAHFAEGNWVTKKEDPAPGKKRR